MCVCVCARARVYGAPPGRGGPGECSHSGPSEAMTRECGGGSCDQGQSRWGGGAAAHSSGSGERWVNTDVSIFLNCGGVSQWLPKSWRLCGGACVVPPLPRVSFLWDPGVPTSLRKLILHVSIAVILFCIWGGAGGGTAEGGPGPRALHPGNQFKGLVVLCLSFSLEG